MSQSAPHVVRAWIGDPPPWLEICAEPPVSVDASLEGLDPGERAAIALASFLQCSWMIGKELVPFAGKEAVGLLNDFEKAVYANL